MTADRNPAEPTPDHAALARELAEALVQYGHHKGNCVCLFEWRSRECDCGYDALLAKARAAGLLK